MTDLTRVLNGAVAAAKRESAQSAQSCPDYYLLPNGIEVKAVARYLTSNAGQAVQYIARSSRLDGNNKGDRVGDLRKAVDMMLDEIERLEAEEVRNGHMA